MIPDDQPEPPPTGRLRPISAGVLVGSGLVALVAGWSLRPLSIRADRPAPDVPGLSVALILFAAAIVGTTAWFTWRSIHRGASRLASHQSVNRLLLGKACAVVGALIIGGYAGNAIAHLGVGESNAGAQVWWSLGAAAAGVVLLVAALLLERACRVPDDSA